MRRRARLLEPPQELAKGHDKMKKKVRKSILSIGGIAKGRKIGAGNEREFTKKTVARRIAKEGLKDG